MKQLFFIIFFFSLFLKISFSQFMFVKSIDSTDVAYKLVDIKTIKFNGNTMNVSLANKSVDALTINKINKISFMDIVGIYSPSAISLSENFQLKIYPNPANDRVSIEYNLNTSSDVEISIYNLSGMLVHYYKNEKKLSGSYTYSWNLTDLSQKRVQTGFYICRMKIADRVLTSKLIIF